MKRSFTLRALVVAGISLASVASFAQAVPLVPNSIVAPLPQTNSGLALGSLIFSSNTPFTGTDFDGTVLFTGTLNTSIFRRADNGLSFVYYAQNNASSTDAIERYSISSFGTFTTSVEQGTPLGTFVPASSATRSANGNVVSFGYAPGTATGSLLPGTSSRFVVVNTNATQYAIGSGQFIAGGVGTALTQVPSAVPEPASLAVIGVGAAALLRRRRK